MSVISDHFHWCGHCRQYVRRSELRNVRPWPGLGQSLGECPNDTQTFAWPDPDVFSEVPDDPMPDTERSPMAALAGEVALEPYYSAERALRDSEVPR